MKQIKDHFGHISIAVMSALLPITIMHASGSGGKLINPLKNGMGLWDLVDAMVKFLVNTIAPIAITLALLWSGFMFIKAQGNTSELEEARRNFFYVVIGSVILLGAYLILGVVLSTVSQITG